MDYFVDRINRIIANDKNLTEDDKNEYGFTLDHDLLISCEYNGEICVKENFTKYWSNEYGYCYSFNSNPRNALNSSVTGFKHGLKLELVVRKYPRVLN